MTGPPEHRKKAQRVVVTPFDIHDMRHPRPASRCKFVSPIAKQPLTTFGTTVREVSLPASSVAAATTNTASGAAQRRERHHPQQQQQHPSAWGATPTHVVAFNTHATDDYLHKHPAAAAGIVGAADDLVSYRAILRKDEDAARAKRDASFYDTASGQRLRAAEFVYQFRASQGEAHNGDLKSLYDGRPLSTFGRSLIVPDVPTKVTTPGPLDYALPVRTEATKTDVSTMRSSSRSEIVFSRCGLVGMRQSRAPTPLSHLVPPTPCPSASGASRHRRQSLSRHGCDSILATRPNSSANLADYGGLMGDSRFTTPGVNKSLDIPSHDERGGGPIGRNLSSLDNPQPLSLIPHADDHRDQADRPCDGNNADTALLPHDATASRCQTTSAGRRTQRCTWSAEPNSDARHARNHDASNAEEQVASRRSVPTPTPLPLSASTSPWPPQVPHTSATTPSLQDLMQDPHFAGIGGTWAGTRFLATHTNNAAYRKQEERRRKLLRIRDSSGSEDIPPEWLERRRVP